MISRRTLLGAAALSLTPLAGCGFRMRGSFDAPFKTLYLQMDDNSRIGAQIIRLLQAGSSVKLVQSPNDAEAILELIKVSRSNNVLSYNDAGRAREYELTLSLTFRVSSPDGFDYMDATRLTTTRDMTYTETEFLSRDTEREFLYKDMEQDLLVQLVRLIEAIQPPSKKNKK